MAKHDLIYVDDKIPGISRRKYGRGYAYYRPDGTHIADRTEVDRLNSLAMPPAYEDCWFCPMPSGHLQATGYDARKRKQYRYHVKYREQRDREKFDLCSDFGEALPVIREQVVADLTRPDMDKKRTLAAIIRLLDTGLLRIGNERYLKNNKTFGATTLNEDHVSVDGSSLRLDYKAKSGKQRHIEMTDKNLAKYVRRLHDLPGQRLFQYFGGDEERYNISSSDVNSYIKALAGNEFSAKHFRTFGASRLAFEILAAAKDNVTIKDLTGPVAKQLGNTQAVTRSSYIHPALIELCNTDLEKVTEKLALPRKTKWLSGVERGLIAFLK